MIELVNNACGFGFFILAKIIFEINSREDIWDLSHAVWMAKQLDHFVLPVFNIS